MINKNKSAYKSVNNSRNHYNSNNTVINLVNIIYDDEFVSLINNLSSSLKDYFKLLNKLLGNIKEIIATLSNQTLYSKCLLNECITSYQNNNNAEKLIQLSDRIDIIDNNKKLLNDNISLIEVNMSSFLDKAKVLFKKMKMTRNSKLNNTIKKQTYFQGNTNINNNGNNFGMDYSNNIYEKNGKRKNLSCNNNLRYNQQKFNQNLFKDGNYTALKKNNMTSKSYSKTLLNNDFNNSNLDINNYNDFNHNINDDRQKTISFNLRHFLFKSNNNIKDNPLNYSNESYNLKNSLNNIQNKHNSLMNYCNLINDSKTKNNRNINVNNNIKYKNISSFSIKNSMKEMNIKRNNISNSIYDYKHCWNKNNLDLKNYNSIKNIQFIPNYFNSTSNLKKDINKKIDINNININNSNKENNICFTIAHKIIDYFSLLNNIDTNEENKYKLKSIKNYLINISLDIIKKGSNSRNDKLNLNLTNSVKLKDNNHINELKNNYMNFSKIYNKNKSDINENFFNEKRNINLSKNKNNMSRMNKESKENIFRNSEQIKIYNSVGNKHKNTVNPQNNIDIIGNNNEIEYNVKKKINYQNNIIDILNHELKKKNECIKKMNSILLKKNRNSINNINNFKIINAFRMQIIPSIYDTKNNQQMESIYFMIKEINLFFKGIKNTNNTNKKDNKQKNIFLNEINILKNNIEGLKLKSKEKDEEIIKNNNIYNHKINELNKTINDLNNEKNNLNKELSNINNKYEKLKLENKSLIEKIKNNNEKNNDNNNSEILSLKKLNDNLNEEIEELKKKLNNDSNKIYKKKYELMLEDLNKKKDEINKLNERIDEINNTNKILTNKLDEMSFINKNLEQEKNNLEVKIKKLEQDKDEIFKNIKNNEKIQDKKIIITNSDYQPEEEFSEIIYNLNDDEQSNYEDKNLIETNKKLQEKINQLQLELNKQILNNKDNKINNNKIMSNNYVTDKKSFINNNDNEDELKLSINKELKIKEDMIEQLQQKINSLTNNNINDIANNKNIVYNHKDYTILCDKNFKNLKFFLLTSKDKVKNKKNEKNKINKKELIYTYENVFWVGRDLLEKDIDKYNSFENENEEENKIIMNYIQKLEEKENIISKLRLRITNFEKSLNDKSTINNEKNSSKNRSKSSNIKPLNDIKLFEKQDEKSEEYKDSDKIEEYNKKSTYGSIDIEKKYYNIEEELRANKNQMQIYKKIFKDLETKLDALKESCKNLFSKLNLSKLEKEEAKQILKLFEFNDNEINFIINRKRNK